MGVLERHYGIHSSTALCPTSLSHRKLSEKAKLNTSAHILTVDSFTRLWNFCRIFCSQPEVGCFPSCCNRSSHGSFSKKELSTSSQLVWEIWVNSSSSSRPQACMWTTRSGAKPRLRGREGDRPHPTHFPRGELPSPRFPNSPRCLY